MRDLLRWIQLYIAVRYFRKPVCLPRSRSADSPVSPRCFVWLPAFQTGFITTNHPTYSTVIGRSHPFPTTCVQLVQLLTTCYDPAWRSTVIWYYDDSKQCYSTPSDPDSMKYAMNTAELLQFNNR